MRGFDEEIFIVFTYWLSLDWTCPRRRTVHLNLAAAVEEEVAEAEAVARALAEPLGKIVNYIVVVLFAQHCFDLTSIT